MILALILAIIIALLIVFIVAVASVAGAVGVILFADVIVCIAILAWVIHRILTH